METAPEDSFSTMAPAETTTKPEQTRNIAAVLEYDGSNYHGWQCQPNGITIQEVVQRSIERILNHEVKIYAAGRTDSGVHAFGQVINFHTRSNIGTGELLKGLNSLLPDDIRVKRATAVDTNFHARYSATAKSYIYVISNTRFHSPFQVKYSWHVAHYLDTDLMNKGIRALIGTHDFSSFKKKNEPYGNHTREITRAWVRRRGALIYVFVEATGFLRYMVRNIVGTLVEVGRGKMGVIEIEQILAARDRTKAGLTAPPHGLFLRRVTYRSKEDLV